jgi:hypothetical protein
MAAIDTLQEITAEVSALESMAYGIDPYSIDEERESWSFPKQTYDLV